MVREVIVTPQDFKIMPTNELEEILQNVLMILLTPKYSVPLDREFGVSANIVDAPINRQSQLTAEIAAAISDFEPRAKLKSISFTGSYLRGDLKPAVAIDIVEENLRG